MVLNRLAVKKVKDLIYVIGLMLLASCSSAPNITNDDSFASRVVKNPVSTQSIVLKGEVRHYLSLDIGHAQKDTLIFYFTGSGCHDISYLLNPLYGQLPINAQLIALKKRGVTAKSTGKTCSDEFVTNDNLDSLVTDSAALMNHFLQRTSYKNIVVIGHSEGGDIIWRLTEKVPAITHVFSLQRGLGMNNLDELNVIAKTKRGKLRGIYNQLITDLEGQSNAYAEDDFILIRNKKSWQISVKDRRNPARVLLNSGKRVLIMMGDKDKHVPVSSMYAAQKVYCDSGSTNLLAIVKKGYGHSIDVGTPQRTTELAILANWIRGDAIELPPPFQRLNCVN